jgi:hypothetical protein
MRAAKSGIMIGYSFLFLLLNGFVIILSAGSAELVAGATTGVITIRLASQATSHRGFFPLNPFALLKKRLPRLRLTGRTRSKTEFLASKFRQYTVTALAGAGHAPPFSLKEA